MNLPTLKCLRGAIDGLDATVASLLQLRASFSRQIQAAKTRAGLPVVDPARENQIQEHYEHRARGSSSVAKAILEWCRNEN